MSTSRRLDVAEVRRLCAEDVSRTEIARTFGVSVAAVSQFLARHRITPPTRRRHGHTIRIDVLARLSRQGLSIREIATAMDASDAGVQRAAQRAGIALQKQSVRIDETRLAELFAEGWQNAEIARRLGASEAGVSRAIQRLGLQRPAAERPRGRKPKQRIDAELLRELCSMGMRPAEIARRLGASDAGVRSAMQRLGLRPRARRVTAQDHVYIAGAIDALGHLPPLESITATGHLARALSALLGRDLPTSGVLHLRRHDDMCIIHELLRAYSRAPEWRSDVPHRDRS